MAPHSEELTIVELVVVVTGFVVVAPGHQPGFLVGQVVELGFLLVIVTDEEEDDDDDDGGFRLEGYSSDNGLEELDVVGLEDEDDEG